MLTDPVILHGWRDWLLTFTGVAQLTVICLPLAALAVLLFARVRIAGGTDRSWAWRRSLAEVGIVYGTLPTVWLTMLPGSHAGTAPGRVSLVPLHDLMTTSPPQLIGNLLLLAALGAFAPMRFRALATLPRVIALAASVSALIEIAQYVFRLDRVSSIDDVLVNTVGAGLAALVTNRWWRARTCRRHIEIRIRDDNTTRT
ncbi:hypothetical protein GCM10009804_67620 [Kribbella hippodromi]|uniref:VanZ-like domain-containing protein n=1 Tax=Kribbella hippodromi TaxID=434347 RepID=A0ABP4Q949_9ACTN